MAEKRKPEEPPEEPSRAAGACVLVVLGGMATAAVFAASPTAGVLAAWAVGALLLWRAARRVSDSSATPPPRGVAPSGDVFADETCEVARVVPIAGGAGCILHPVRVVVGETPDND